MELDGGEYRYGTWSVNEDVLTLRFDDGEIVKCLYGPQGLRLAYEGGILLDTSHYMYIE